MKTRNKIFIIGFMGAGKTTISKQLADDLGWELIEIDQIIEEQSGLSIKEIFSTFGEEFFRQKEAEVLQSLASKENIIVSCGGGIVLNPENVDFFKNYGLSILLTATPQTIYHRIKAESTRPLLENKISPDFIEHMLKERAELYDKAAEIKISTDNKTVKEISYEIISYLKGN